MSDGRVGVTCAFCQAQFERCPGSVKSRHGAQYCSRKCAYAGRSAGITPRICDRPYVISDRGLEARKKSGQKAAATRKERGNNRHTDATRSKIAHATAQNIASGKINRVSGIEDVVAKVLDRIGVAYRRQVGIRGSDGRYFACVDFMLGDRTVLEVNGTFWHADPRMYPDRSRLSPAQRRTVERYGVKVDRLRKSGFDVIEVWEADLAKDSEDAVANVLRSVVR